jgi:hypothetical protein
MVEAQVMGHNAANAAMPPCNAEQLLPASSPAMQCHVLFKHVMTILQRAVPAPTVTTLQAAM